MKILTNLAMQIKSLQQKRSVPSRKGLLWQLGLTFLIQTMTFLEILFVPEMATDGHLLRMQMLVVSALIICLWADVADGWLIGAKPHQNPKPLQPDR